MKTKKDLKTVFAGLSSIMLQKAQIDTSSASITISADFDLPVTVDTLSISQGAPSINHYKVHGMATDWTSTATPSDAEISLTIPSVHEDLIEYFFGAGSAVTATLNGSTNTFAGSGYKNDPIKCECSLVLMNDTEDKLFVIAKASLWASIQYENGSTEPIAISISGTIEGNDTDPDFLYLEKSTTPPEEP